MNVQAVGLRAHPPLIKDAKENGITKTADSTSVTAKITIETFVGVRSCGFLQKTTHVNKFPRNARTIKATIIVDPMTISVVVKWCFILVSCLETLLIEPFIVADLALLKFSFALKLRFSGLL